MTGGVPGLDQSERSTGGRVSFRVFSSRSFCCDVSTQVLLALPRQLPEDEKEVMSSVAGGRSQERRTGSEEARTTDVKTKRHF